MVVVLVLALACLAFGQMQTAPTPKAGLEIDRWISRALPVFHLMPNKTLLGTDQKKPEGLSRFETLARLRLALRVKMNARQNPSTAPKKAPIIVSLLNDRLPWPAHKKPT